MKDRKQFFKDGFIFDKLDNYQDIFDYELMKELKTEVNDVNVSRGSRYIYEYTYNERKINELLIYDDVKKNVGKDSDIDMNKLSDEDAEFLFNLEHESKVNKIKSIPPGPEPFLEGKWIFGELNDEIEYEYRKDVFKQQVKFVKHYYSDYENVHSNRFSFGNTLIQFYDEGCVIAKHRDGAPFNRICTFLYFLNNEWDSNNGGQLVINPRSDNPIVVEPIFPNFVVLDQTDSAVDNEHEVLKVNSDTKLTYTSFFEVKE
tara:strand:- start:15 stop:791 length:777 start_codon:yes stop_codon:yes gene_type:complete